MPGPGVRPVSRYQPVNPAAYQQARSEFWAYNNWGAALVSLWLTLLFLVMLGFSYSFFWCAATMIYFLMRKRVDEAELDEVYLEDEEPEPPLAPPKIAEGTTAAGSGPGVAALPVITPTTASAPSTPPPPVVPPPPFEPKPALTPPSPPAMTSSPPPSAADTIPFSASPPPPPKKDDEQGPLG